MLLLLLSVFCASCFYCTVLRTDQTYWPAAECQVPGVCLERTIQMARVLIAVFGVVVGFCALKKNIYTKYKYSHPRKQTKRRAVLCVSCSELPTHPAPFEGNSGSSAATTSRPLNHDVLLLLCLAPFIELIAMSLRSIPSTCMRPHFWGQIIFMDGNIERTVCTFFFLE